MSKTFDTINRVKLENMIEDYTFASNCDLLELLYTNNTLSAKIGKENGREFSSNRNVSEGDGLSPKLFVF